MGISEREDRVVSEGQDGTQKQSVVRHSAPLSTESPSTVYKFVQNESLLRDLERRLAGYTQQPDEATGRMVWMVSGSPLINIEGRSWLIAQIAQVTHTSTTLSNYPESRLRPIQETDYRIMRQHMVQNMKRYNLTVETARTVLKMYMEAHESAYRRATGDKGARHVFGSIEESVTGNPQKQDKILGILPKPF